MYNDAKNIATEKGFETVFEYFQRLVSVLNEGLTKQFIGDYLRLDTDSRYNFLLFCADRLDQQQYLSICITMLKAHIELEKGLYNDVSDPRGWIDAKILFDNVTNNIKI